MIRQASREVGRQVVRKQSRHPQRYLVIDESLGDYLLYYSLNYDGFILFHVTIVDLPHTHTHSHLMHLLTCVLSYASGYTHIETIIMHYVVNRDVYIYVNIHLHSTSGLSEQFRVT